MDYLKEMELAKKLAIKAGEAIMKVYETEDFGVTYKDDSSPLTKADRAANDIIVPGLKEGFPSYAVLSEEEMDDKARLDNDLCFIVDPLDGTKEFIKRNGQFTVNIALSYKHKSIMGVIYVPVTKELYYAYEGYGAYLDTEDEKGIKLNVTDTVDKSALRMVMSSSHGDERVDKLVEKYNIKDHVSMGSSLKGCIIAKGGAEVYYRYKPTMEWDTAAMQCIVEEAGGVFRQTDDSEMRYNRENNVNEIGFYILNNVENRLEL
ncbi:MAG: 3'(2'),5'-bisphosphate nucleotidase CysQ [Lachnospiraceae bacterium]|nr:3'(2'),5'-bisphosphate nucleotidase CysQ [Lachnospiraceae bacterium]